MKKKRKKRISFKKIFIFLILFLLLGVIIYYIFTSRIKNIIILNNNYYKDIDIIEKCNIEDYPKFIFLNTNKLENKLKELDLIEEAKISKKWGNKLIIDVKEKKILYYIRSNDEYMLSDGNTIKLDNIAGKPTLISYVPEEIEASFIKSFKKIDNNIISLISEIEYSKTNYDERRFKLYMNDGNLVYITVSKVDVLNKYINIVQKLDNKKGILYLDSGNYFEIKD